MSKSLEEIRKKLQALDTRKGPASGGNGDKTTYPHWNIPEGSSATIRLLPDGNESNDFFWVEKQMIKLSFPGIKGHDEHKPIEIQVPCIEMWDGKNKCPILNEVRPMWKDPSLEAIARKYWIKKTYYMQGFVKSDPLGETDAPENPIRKFMITNQIYAIIKAALMDNDMTTNPVDYINGTDFIINKTSKGGYADYGTSKWARKETSITPEMQDAIDQYGLVDLSTYLPKRPTPEQLAAMFDMFQASLEGELYDPAKWAQFYKPYGFDTGTSSNADSRPAPAPARAVQAPAPKPAVINEDQLDTDDNEPPFDGGTKSEPAPVESTGAATAAKSPQEILAMLRNRNK